MTSAGWHRLLDRPPYLDTKNRPGLTGPSNHLAAYRDQVEHVSIIDSYASHALRTTHRRFSRSSSALRFSCLCGEDINDRGAGFGSAAPVLHLQHLQPIRSLHPPTCVLLQPMTRDRTTIDAATCIGDAGVRRGGGERSRATRHQCPARNWRPVRSVPRRHNGMQQMHVPRKITACMRQMGSGEIVGCLQSGTSWPMGTLSDELQPRG